MTPKRLSVICLLAVLVAPPARAQCEEILLVAPAASNDAFGEGVAVAPGVVLVGDSLDDNPVQNAGTVFVYEKSEQGGWLLVDELVASDRQQSDFLGRSIAVDGDRGVAGATGVETSAGVDSGAAYVFERTQSGWIEVQKLFPSDPVEHLNFGTDVAVSGNRILVGAELVGVSNAVYVSELIGTTWLEVARLTPSDPGPGDRFGLSVALFGNIAVVGAYRHEHLGTVTGAAFVFEEQGGVWGEVAELRANDLPGGDFGQSVSCAGDLVAVGAPSAPVGNLVQVGAVYLFSRSAGWAQIQKLVPSDPTQEKHFGQVAIAGLGRLVVGARGYAVPTSGGIYIFERTGTDFVEVRKVTGSSAVQSYVGWPVAAAESIAVAGAPGLGNGAALVLDPLYTRLGDRYCPPEPNSTGVPARIDAIGSPLLDADCLELVVRDLPPAQHGFFMLSREAAFVPLFGGSHGNLCLGLPIVRFPDILYSGTGGLFEFRPHLGALPQGTTFQIGETWRFQCWYRDIVGFDFTSNTSGGIALRFF